MSRGSNCTGPSTQLHSGRLAFSRKRYTRYTHSLATQKMRSACGALTVMSKTVLVVGCERLTASAWRVSPHLRNHAPAHGRIRPRSGDQSLESATLELRRIHTGRRRGSAGSAFSDGDARAAELQRAGGESGWDDLIIPMSRVAWRSLEAAKSPLLQTIRDAAPTHLGS
jgi:hypothetical protein